MKRWIEVKVKPNSKESSIHEDSGGNWVARIKSPPVDGKANQELIKLVAKQFGVKKSRVSIRMGASSRLKRLQIDE